MIVCSCNVLNDREVRACCSGPDAPRYVHQIYERLGCAPDCGKCAPSLFKIMKEARRNAAPPRRGAQTADANGRSAAP